MVMRNFILLSTFFLFFDASEAQAHNRFFTVLRPARVRAIIGNYPAPSSPEETRDFDILLKYQDTRTEEECAEAAKEEKTSVTAFFARENGPLTKAEARRVSWAILKAYAESGVNSYIAKRTYRRPRPYITNPLIKPCIKLEHSYAYPSGHTLMARVFAHVLSRKFPERADAFLRRADEVAENRVIGGVHHPSDIEAGKKLGDVIARKLLASQKFLMQLESL